MVRRVIILALAGAASLSSSSRTFAQPPPGSLFVRFVAAVGAMPMGDLDGYVGDNLSTLLTPGAPRTMVEEMGVSVVAGGEAGFMLSPLWSVGVSMTTSDASSSAVFGSLFVGLGSTSLTAKITEVTATASFWPRGGGGLFASAEAGAAFGRLEESFDYSSFAGDALAYKGHWEGTGFVGGLFAGYQHRLRGGFNLLAQTGYKFRNLGVLPGDRTITASTYSAYPTGTTSGPIRDSSGRALESDFSVFYVGLGVGWSFGGR